MAEVNELAPSFGNFSIQDTMEMGMGNAELISNLMSPETSTASPDDIKKIEEQPPVEKKPVKQAAKPADEKKPEDEAPKENPLKDFFGKDDDEEEEEEEEEPKDDKKKAPKAKTDDTPPSDEDEPTEESSFAALSKDLFKLGVFSKDEDEEDVQISTPEEFLERFNLEKKKGAIEVVQNFIGQFGEDYQNAFDAIFVKGVNPQDYFGTYNKIKSFSELDLSKEENQEAVLRQSLTDQGMDSEDISTEIERLKNYGDLENVAQKHHKVLVKKEGAKLAQMEQEKEAQLKQQAAIKQQYINNVQTVLQEKIKAKEFDGIPINPKLAGELQDFLLVEKYKTPSGDTLTDFDRTILELKRPENHAMKVKVALLLKTLEKDPSLTTIQKKGITNKTNELFGEVARHTSKSSTKSSGDKTAPKSWFA